MTLSKIPDVKGTLSNNNQRSSFTFALLSAQITDC